MEQCRYCVSPAVTVGYYQYVNSSGVETDKDGYDAHLQRGTYFLCENHTRVKLDEYSVGSKPNLWYWKYEYLNGNGPRSKRKGSIVMNVFTITVIGWKSEASRYHQTNGIEQDPVILLPATQVLASSREAALVKVGAEHLDAKNVIKSVTIGQ